MTRADIFRSLPVLRTGRLILRPMLEADSQDIFAYAQDPEVSRHVPWEPHQSLADTHKFINSVLADYAAGQVNNWALELSGSQRMVGTAGFINWFPEHRRAEIGYTLARDLWGKGLMTEAVREIISFGFQVLDLVRIEARCQIPNLASARVLEKCGLKLEGVLRSYYFSRGAHHDLKTFALLRKEWEIQA